MFLSRWAPRTLFAGSIALSGAAVLAISSAPVRVALVAAVALICLAIGVQRLRPFLERASLAARLAAALSAVLALVVAGAGAYAIRFWPPASFAILTAGVCAAIAIRQLLATEPDIGQATSAPPLGLRIALTAAVFAVSIAVSLVVRHGFSTNIAPDTISYWTPAVDLLNGPRGWAPLRTPQYSLLFALARLVGGNGQLVLLMQYGLRAGSSALLAWMLGRRSLLAGGVVGFFLAVDPVSAATSVSYLSESLYTSGLVFACAMAVWQLTARPRALRARTLLLSGCAFGLALLVRPSSAGLIAVVLAAYLAVTRSVLKPALVAAGYGTIAVAIATFNYVRYGMFVVVATGVYLVFPLFVHNLMDPGNGPASRRIDAELRTCYPGIDYSRVSVDTANAFVYGKLLPCAARWYGDDTRRTYAMYDRAYREALLAHPAVFTWRILIESFTYMGVVVADYAQEVGEGNQVLRIQDVCTTSGSFAGYPRELAAFVCPVSAPDPKWLTRVILGARMARLVYQPYLLVYDPRLFVDSSLVMDRPELVGAGGVLFFVLVLAVCRRAYRPIAAAAILVILFNAAITALGQVTLRRYVAPVSPFFLVVTGLLLVSLAEQAVEMLRAIRGTRRSDTLGRPLRADVRSAGIGPAAQG